MEFCKAFNAETENLEKNMHIPVVITVFVDKSFSLIQLLFLFFKSCATRKKSSEPGRDFVGTVKLKQVREIAESKMKDLNAADIKGAIKMVEGVIEYKILISE